MGGCNSSQAMQSNAGAVPTTKKSDTPTPEIPPTNDPKYKGRQDMFQLPHKAFRYMWTEATRLVGSLDVTDKEEVERTADAVLFACKIYLHHNHIESETFAPPIKNSVSIIHMRQKFIHQTYLTITTHCRRNGMACMINGLEIMELMEKSWKIL